MSKEELVEKGHLFCRHTFLVGIIRKIVNIIFCKATAVFALITAIMFEKDLFYDFTHWIGFLVFAGVFLFYECLVFLLKNKTNININANAGLNINK